MCPRFSFACHMTIQTWVFVNLRKMMAGTEREHTRETRPQSAAQRAIGKE
jgi:hypothetical protein